MRKVANTKKIINIFIRILLIGFIIYEMICLVTGNHEMVLQRKTDMATKCIYDLGLGENPYNADWIYDENALPVNYYESGFFHVLPAVGLVKLGMPVRMASMVVHIVYIVLGLVMVGICVYELTKSLNLALAASAIMFYIMDVIQPTLVRPDNLCRVIILLITYIILKYFKEEGPSGHYKIREWVLAFLLVLQGFLKIHYASVLVAVYVIYLLNWKNKRWIWFTLKGMAVTVLMAAICQICFPTFFSTFGVRVLEMFFINASATGGSVEDMLEKWVSLFSIYPVLILVVILGSLVNIKKWRNIYQDNRVAFLFVNILVNVAGLCFMGKWPGNGIVYHNVMLTGTLLVAGCWYVHGLICDLEERLKINSNGKTIIRIIIMIVIIGGQLLICTYKYSDVRIKPWNVDTSNKDKIIETFSHYNPEDVLLVSNGYIAFELGWYQWDYGDQIYIPNNTGTSPRWNLLFPYTNDYRERMVDYCGKMIEKIQNKEYKVIVNGDDRGFGVKLGYEDAYKEAIAENYILSDIEGVRCYVPK